MTRNFESLKNKLANSRLRLIPGLFEANSGLTEANAPLLRGEISLLTPPKGLQANFPEGLPLGRYSTPGNQGNPCRATTFRIYG